MNERSIPEFTADEIKRRLSRLEGLTGKTIDQNPVCLSLIADVVMTLARQCNLVNDQRMK